MPLPSLKKNETDKEFISRCAADPVMNKEFPDNKRRLAVCFSQLKQAKKKKESKGSLEEPTWDEWKEEIKHFIILP